MHTTSWTLITPAGDLFVECVEHAHVLDAMATYNEIIGGYQPLPIAVHAGDRLLAEVHLDGVLVDAQWHTITPELLLARLTVDELIIELTAQLLDDIDQALR